PPASLIVNNVKCDIEPPLICSDCLHEVLEKEFDNWSSGNLLIDEFIQKAQQSLSYIQYPEWIPYNFFTEIKRINRGEFGAVISAKWTQDMKYLEQFLPTKEVLQDQTYYCCLYGITQVPSTLEYMLVESASVCDRCFSKIIERIKCFSIINGDKYYTRSEPCTVALKQLEGEKDSVHLFLKEIQAQFNCCHLYGVTKDPSTSQYMFVMRYAPQGDLRRFLQKNFDKLTIENKLKELTLDEYRNQDNRNKKYIHGEGAWLWEWDGTNLSRELLNSHNATNIYNIMKWKPDIPIHKDAVYKSRMISISDKYMTRQNDMTLKYEISDIPYMSL
ncbi:22901_t:CDS:2, partial [Dentiscutata erythropus]